MTLTIRTLLQGSCATALCLTASIATASSHREAPGITEQPKIDATDFYMFKSYEANRGDYVTLIANYQPLQAPYGGPNYFTMDPDAIYEIHVSNDADAEEEITFQFQFDNNLKDGTGIQLDIGGEKVGIPLRAAGQITASSPTAALGETESYSVTMITGDRRSGKRTSLSHGGGTTFTKPLDNVGNKTLPDYAEYANAYIYDDVKIPGCGTGRVFAGQRAEAFAVNLGEIFDLVNLVPVQGPDNPMWSQYNDPNFNATITGTVTSYSNITINAGGNTTFATGSSTTGPNDQAWARSLKEMNAFSTFWTTRKWSVCFPVSWVIITITWAVVRTCMSVTACGIRTVMMPPSCN